MKEDKRGIPGRRTQRCKGREAVVWAHQGKPWEKRLERTQGLLTPEP